jgi:transcriptional regulator with XRE-family HTH domain
MEHKEALRAFGKRVRELRRRRGLTQQVLADLADIHVNYVRMIERGEANPSLIVIHSLATVFGITGADMIAE